MRTIIFSNISTAIRKKQKIKKTATVHKLTNINYALLLYTINTIVQHEFKLQLQLFLPDFIIISLWVCLAAQ